MLPPTVVLAIPAMPALPLVPADPAASGSAKVPCGSSSQASSVASVVSK
jgi:hypothetical protein